MAKPSCQGTPPLAMPCSLRSGVFSGSPRGCMSPSPSRLLKEMDLSTWQERGYDLGGCRAGLYEQLSLFSALLCSPTTSVRTGPHQWSRDHQCHVYRKRKTTIWSGWDPTGDPLVLSFRKLRPGERVSIHCSSIHSEMEAEMCLRFLLLCSQRRCKKWKSNLSWVKESVSRTVIV